MFSKQQASYLRGKLNSNQVILFLGAGFSTLAKNRLGEAFPAASQLAADIAVYLGHQDHDPRMTLKQMFELLLRSGKPKNSISVFINEKLTTVAAYVPTEYDVLASIFWHRIYTSNVDNVLPLIYDRGTGPSLDVISYPDGEPSDRDPFLGHLQAVYLHGKLPGPLDHLIFSQHQYALSSTVRQPLYDQFIREYSTYCTIFVGTSFDWELALQYIELRKQRRRNINEHRPRSFLIDPDISTSKRALLKVYNIEAIEAGVGDFLSWLRSNKSEIADREALLLKTVPDLKLLSALPHYHDHVGTLRQFALAFTGVPMVGDRASDSRYLLGTAPTWEDIHTGLDVSRSITPTIVDEITDAIEKRVPTSVVAVLGSGGAGKSTILKRLGVELVIHGMRVYHTDSSQVLAPHTIAEALILFDGPTVLLFDNAELVLRELHNLISALVYVPNPVVIVLATRTNTFDRLAGKLESSVKVRQYQIPHLTRTEIVGLIRTLEQDGKLGKLRGMSEKQRIREFEVRARKQILVAMREATSGLGFDEIIRDEFETIQPEEARTLCLCVALATAAGYFLTKPEFVGCSPEDPATTLHYLNRNLNGIVVATGPNQDRLSVRHRRIAEHQIVECRGSQVLREAYCRLLNVLAPRINASHWRARVFQMYRELINHTTVLEYFYEKVEEARRIYGSIESMFASNYHFWLQYGSLEMEAGDLELAENYLHQAHSLKGNDGYVVNALGDLALRQGEVARSPALAIDLRYEGERLLREQMEGDGATSAYSYHIYVLRMYNWIRSWINEDGLRTRELADLKRIVHEGMDRHPLNKPLKELSKVIDRAYLYMGIDKSKRPKDPIYSPRRRERGQRRIGIE